MCQSKGANRRQRFQAEASMRSSREDDCCYLCSSNLWLTHTARSSVCCAGLLGFVFFFFAVTHKRCVQGYFLFHTGLGVEDEDTGTDKETNLLKLAGADAVVIAVQMEAGPSHHACCRLQLWMTSAIFNFNVAVTQKLQYTYRMMAQDS